MSGERRSTEVAIVGGGPAGLAAATGLAAAGAAVVVIEREREAGGVPRHADHQGFGLRDLHRVQSGPGYARGWVRRASAAGAEIRTATQVTGWDDGRLATTGAGGRGSLAAEAVLLASGCRERPRSARWVPGARVPGVMTTGTLQQAVYLEGRRFEGRAVVVGAEHVSFSALETLRHAGARPVAMVTELPAHQSFFAFRAGAVVRHRVSPQTRTRLSSVLGRGRVEAVELTDLDSGAVRRVPCELVIFTADWIPDNELAVVAGVELDPGTRGPRIDASQRTAIPGVFAAGNLLHGAETADVASLSGSRVVAGILDYLERREWPARVPILSRDPLAWVVPNAVSLGPVDPERPARHTFLVRARRELLGARILVRQGGETLHEQRLARVGPGRSARLRDDWVRLVEPDRGAVECALLDGRSRRSWSAI